MWSVVERHTAWLLLVDVLLVGVWGVVVCWCVLVVVVVTGTRPGARARNIFGFPGCALSASCLDTCLNILAQAACDKRLAYPSQVPSVAPLQGAQDGAGTCRHKKFAAAGTLNVRRLTLFRIRRRPLWGDRRFGFLHRLGLALKSLTLDGYRVKTLCQGHRCQACRVEGVRGSLQRWRGSGIVVVTWRLSRETGGGYLSLARS